MTSLTPTLQELIATESYKWVFVGGKGGVGKTTTSASLAMLLAQTRESVLILSTDPAHNLGDAFFQKFSNRPTLVNGFKNLYAMEIDTNISESFRNFSGGQDSLDFSSILPELVSTFPGIDEALGFAELMNSVRTMNYSVIVFDTAPTGHTLRLIGFPALLEASLLKLSGFREKISGALNMMSSLAGDIVNTEELNQKFDSLRALTSSVKQILQDPTRTTFVCVCIPEFLSVYETERLVQELAKHQIDSSNIVVNQVLFPIEEAEAIRLDDLPTWRDIETIQPATNLESDLIMVLQKAKEKINKMDQHYIARRRMQSKYLQQIEDLYSFDFHVVPMPMQTTEIRGAEKLSVFGNLLLKERVLPIVAQLNV